MTIRRTATTAARWMAWVGPGADLRTTGPNAGPTLAFPALAGMPLLFGAAGFLAGALAALLVRLVRRP